MDRPAPDNRWRFWLAAAAAFLVVLWLFNEILLPFVVGMVIAYFFDPVVARLQRYGLSRTVATVAVTILAVLIAIGAATAIVPPLLAQIEDLAAKAPQYVVQVAARIQPMIEPLRQNLGLPPLSLHDVQAEAAQWAGQALGILGSVISRVAQRGAAIINLFALLFLTPVVTFYLLRDWPKVLAAIDNALPLDHAETIRKLAHDRASTWEIGNQATKEGMRTLRHDGWRKVLAGRTTVDEVVRATKIGLAT